VYVLYEAEPKERQTAKTVPVFILSRKGDCKHYSSFAVGYLNSCGIPAWFSVVRQTDDRNRWHVYASAIVDNEIVVIDPCRKRFNDECSFKRKYNVPPIKN
jgi:transglutaminase-like putative cysteine protease